MSTDEDEPADAYHLIVEVAPGLEIYTRVMPVGATPPPRWQPITFTLATGDHVRVIDGDTGAALAGDDLAEAVRILGPLPDFDLGWLPAGDVTVQAAHGWRGRAPYAPAPGVHVSGWLVSVVAPGAHLIIDDA